MKVNFPHIQELPELVEGEVQTRSEVTGLTFFDTLEQAVKHAEEDKTVWKLSYKTATGHKRIVIR